jgi:ABC-type phosphate transport system permease subunit
MRDVFEVTPTLLKESLYGLGATTWGGRIQSGTAPVQG